MAGYRGTEQSGRAWVIQPKEHNMSKQTGTASGPICISIINMKGGVGKTTVAALLARYASLHLKLNVLAVDLDPQANLSQAFMGSEKYRSHLASHKPSIVELFHGYQPPTGGRFTPTPLDIKEVVVGGLRLGGQNVELIPSRFDFSDNLVREAKSNPRMLAHCIAEQFQDKDLVIIDCAPTESIFTRAAFLASRYVLVPVKPEFFSTIGFPLLAQSLNSFRNENKGHKIDVIGIVINNAAYDSWSNPEKEKSLREILEESEKQGWHVFRNQLPLSRGFSKIMRGDFSYPGNAHRYEELAKEVFERLGI